MASSSSVARLLARAALEHRSDDTPEVIAQRLALYHEVTSPIVAWYRDRGVLVCVDAMRSAPEVGREVLTALEAIRPSLDHAASRERIPADRTSLGEAFGATGSALASPGEPAGSRWAAPRAGSPAAGHRATAVSGEART